MSELTIEERVANIERQLFGLSYEEAKPIYDRMLEVIKAIEGEPTGKREPIIKIQYVEANQGLLKKLERVLGIKSNLTF